MEWQGSVHATYRRLGVWPLVWMWMMCIVLAARIVTATCSRPTCGAAPVGTAAALRRVGEGEGVAIVRIVAVVACTAGVPLQARGLGAGEVCRPVGAALVVERSVHTRGVGCGRVCRCGRMLGMCDPRRNGCRRSRRRTTSRRSSGRSSRINRSRRGSAPCAHPHFALVDSFMFSLTLNHTLHPQHPPLLPQE